MHNLMQSPATEAPQWVRAIEAKYAGKGKFDKEDWDKLLGHSQAVCDLPAGLFCVELAEFYPDAKIIILNRDPEDWYESVLKSIYTVTKPTKILTIARLIYCVLLDSGMASMKNFGQAMHNLAMPYDHGKEKDKAIASYKAIYAEYRERIPKDRYIEMTVKDGWKPLCDYLEVPVPTVRDETTGKLVDAPFPRMNDRTDFLATSENIRDNALARANNNLFVATGKLALTGTAGYVGYVIWKTWFRGRF